jgi:hypothetical protein
MSRPERFLEARDIERVHALIPSLAKPGESLDESFFRIAVELAVLEHKLDLTGADFEALLRADWVDPVIRKRGATRLAVSWTWVEDPGLELPLPS